MSEETRCVCGRKPVNDAGVCEDCFYHGQGVTVEYGTGQFDLLKVLLVESRVFGTESMIKEMDKFYNDLKWEEKER